MQFPTPLLLLLGSCIAVGIADSHDGEAHILMMEAEKHMSVDWAIIVSLSVRSRKKTYDKNGHFLHSFMHGHHY